MRDRMRTNGMDELGVTPRRGVRPIGLAGLIVLVVLALRASSASAEPIAYPDLQLLMPTGDIAIVHKGTTRTLEFTHITWDAGAGPLEIRPSYNPSTGISQGYQALYTSPSPKVWKFAQTVPIVGPMIWTPPSDYNFPLNKFTLHDVAPGGGIGSLVETSPKVLYCMTSDTFVGGVPNAPNVNEYPPSACAEPQGKLGLTVGWGDQYEATDGGEGIPISSLPNGTYWLRGIVDPDHYFLESNAANNITDTKLRIEGTTVKVLEQIKPEATPPTATLTSPAAGTTISGTVALTATASGPSAISSVQFLLDGEPISAPVTAPPYTIDWAVGSTTPGTHFLSAQAIDSEGFVGTAADVPVTVGARIGRVAIDKVVSESGTTTTTTPSFSTSEAGEVLLAFADSDGPSTGGQTLTVSGAGLNWSLVKRANAQGGDAEVWTATAIGSLLNATVTATASETGFAQSLTVTALSGAAGVGTSASASASKGAPALSLTSTQVGSAAFATGDDAEHALGRTVGSGQSLLEQSLATSAGDSFWTQYATAPSSAAGQTMTLDDTAPTSDSWNMAAVEVLAASAEPDKEPPTVSIVNPTPGETVSGTTQVSANATDDFAVASVQFFLDGKALGAPVTQPPYAISWDTTAASEGSHTLIATATDTSGNVGDSAPVSVTVQNPVVEETCFTADVTTSVEGGSKVKTQSFTTAEAGEQLFAFVSADGPATAGAQSAKVSGAGLAWRLLKRANSQSGDAEIWTAEATSVLKHKKVKSKLALKGFSQELTVIAMQGAKGAGATVAGGASSGEPSVTLSTQGGRSLVYAVGSDADHAIGRTLGSNQTLMRQELDTAAGKTFWSQFTSAITGPAGSLVTLNDTAPTGDRWNMAAVEILASEI
jgi:Bacterial Ig domain/Lysyl oxidase